MIRSGTVQGEQANRRHLKLENGTTYYKSDVVVSPAGESPSPQAFLIEQDPNTVIRAHFHQQNQFQVVVAGEGTLGRHPVAPITVQYASRHTGYGPITAGEHGVSYFSMRPITTAGAYYLPDRRSEIEDIPKRHLMGQPAVPSDPAQLRARTEPAIDTVIEPQPDGIAAWMLRLPPKSRLAPPSEGQVHDRFYVVAQGSMQLDGKSLPRLAVTYVTSDERDFELVAGDEGLEVVVMQFPPRDPAMEERGTQASKANIAGADIGIEVK